MTAAPTRDPGRWRSSPAGRVPCLHKVRAHVQTAAEFALWAVRTAGRGVTEVCSSYPCFLDHPCTDSLRLWLASGRESLRVSVCHNPKP